MERPQATLRELRETGMSSFTISPDYDRFTRIFERMRRDAERAKHLPFMWQPVGVEDGWVGVNRATFFTGTVNRAAMPLKNQIAKTVYPATRWVRGALIMTAPIEVGLKGAGHELDTPELVTPTTNIGINFMQGTADQPAHIAEHRDPLEEKGVVTVVSLDDRQISLIACANVCQAWGIDRPWHSHETERQRFSYTFAHYDYAA